MKRGFLFIITVFFFIAILNPASAELVDRKHVFIIGGGLGLQYPLNEKPAGVYRSGMHYYAKSGFGIASHFSLIGEFAGSRYRVAEEFKGLDARSYLFHYLAGGIRYNFVAGAYIIPYAEGLLGVTHFRFSEYVDATSGSRVRTDIFPIAIAAFGSEFFMGPNWCIEGSIEMYNVFGDVYLQPRFTSAPDNPPKYDGTQVFKPLGFNFRIGFLIFL
jgi:hypothetical protein